MGLILDLAVIVLAGVVIISLATLTWTLAVSLVREVRVARDRVAETREAVARAEAGMRASASDPRSTTGDDRHR